MTQTTEETPRGVVGGEERGAAGPPSLADFLGPSLEKPSESPAVAGGESGADTVPSPVTAGAHGTTSDDRVPGDDQQEGFSSEEQPVGVSQVTTPRGLEVYYQAGPKRLYRVRDAVIPEAEWIEVPSVTTVLNLLHKPALTWWGMKVGVEGVATLYREDPDYALSMADAFNANAVDAIVDRLTEKKLTVNHVKDKAAKRGTAVHDALEVWATAGIPPQPKVFPEEERGYVEGLNQFLIDSGAEPVAQELMVGSVRYGFAGRYDVDLQIPNGAEVVVKQRKRQTRVRLEGGLYRSDLKTSKGVYDSHFLQLEAYEGAAIECGYPESNFRAVIHVMADGTYEFVRSTATFYHFVAVKEAWDAVEDLKRRKP